MAKPIITQPVNLPSVNIGPEPKGVLNLPQVNIEEEKPMTPAPAGSINVINPDGQLGYVPIDWLVSEGIKKGYTLPPSKDIGPSQDDITPDKQIKVVRKDDGTEGMVPLDWFLSDPNAKNYEVLSKAEASGLKDHIKQTNEYVNAFKDPLHFRIDKDLNIVKGADYKPEEDKEGLNKITDEKGNYKMIAPSGESVIVPKEHMMALLESGAGFKFADPKFQAMVDAQKKIQGESEAKGAFQTGLASTARSILPGGDYLQKRDIHTSESALERASYIASNLLTNSDKFETAKTVGTVLGVGAQLLSPTGLFGEAKLAGAVKTGIAAKLAPEGAGFLRQLAVKGLATGAEGAIISSPQALAQVALDKDPKAAAESLAAGFGIGAFLGVGGKLLGGTAKLAEKGIEHFKPNIADRIVESAGGDVKAFEKFGTDKKDFVDALLDKGLSSKSKTDDVLGALKKLSVGEDLVPILKKLDQTGVKTSVSDLISELGGSARAFEGIDHAVVLKGFEEKLISLADKEGKISLENLQKFVREAGEEIKWSPIDLKKGVGIASEDLAKTAFWGQANQKLIELGDEAASKVDAKTAAQWLNKKAISNMAQYVHAIYFTTEEGAFRATEELNPLVKKLTGELAGKALSGAGTIAGGTVGGLIGGGLPGAVAGGAAGGAAIEGLKKIGGPLLEKAELSLVDHYADSGSKLGSWLVKNKTASAIGSYLALDATKSLASKVESIGPFLDKLRTTAEKTPAMYLSAQDPIKTILGSEANGLSKAQQYSKLAEKAATYASNPTVKQQVFDLHIAPLFKDHPELAKQVMADYDKKFQVINDILSKGNTKQPEAFVKSKPFQPTAPQMKEIEDKLKVVNNPFALLDGLKNGKVTKAQVDLVAQLNPAILQKMREELIKSAYGGKATLSYQQRLSASIIMGAPLDPSLTNGQLLQSTYNNGNNNSNAPEKQSRKQGNSKPLKADRIAGYSLSQRISKV